MLSRRGFLGRAVAAVAAFAGLAPKAAPVHPGAFTMRRVGDVITLRKPLRLVTLRKPLRLDVLHGYGALRPDFAVRVMHDSWTPDEAGH